jgi:hypothetical protein
MKLRTRSHKHGMASLLTTSTASSGTRSDGLPGSLRMMESILANEVTFASSCRLQVEIGMKSETFWTPYISILLITSWAQTNHNHMNGSNNITMRTKMNLFVCLNSVRCKDSTNESMSSTWWNKLERGRSDLSVDILSIKEIEETDQDHVNDIKVRTRTNLCISRDFVD